MILSDIAILRNGKFIPESQRNGNINIYGSTGIIGKTNEILVNTDAVVIGRVGANCGVVQYAAGPSWITDNCVICLAKENNLKYIYYLLQSKNLHELHSGSAQPLLTGKVLNSISISEHSSEQQSHIVDTKCYSSLSKIARIFLSSSAPCNINSRSSCLTFTIAAWISSSDILPESSMPTYLPGTRE